MIIPVLLLAVLYVALIVVVDRCADGRIGVNGFAGLRTPTIMTNDATWQAGHQAARTPTRWGVAGALVATVGALFVPGEPLQATALLVGCGLLLAGVLSGAALGTRAARQVLGTP